MGTFEHCACMTPNAKGSEFLQDILRFNLSLHVTQQQLVTKLIEISDLQKVGYIQFLEHPKFLIICKHLKENCEQENASGMHWTFFWFNWSETWL